MTETVDWRLPMPPGFRWPDGVRAAACFTFDVDAESPILYEYPESAAWLDVMSHQAYGARTGIARILRVLDRRRIRSTFFIPGYSAERWPAICRSIRDAGHEIAHHGYVHEGAHGATPDIEEARLLAPLFCFAGAIALGLAWLVFVQVPQADTEVQLLRQSAFKEAQFGQLDAGRFRSFSGGDAVFYAERVDSEGVLHNVFVQRETAGRIELALADTATYSKAAPL